MSTNQLPLVLHLDINGNIMPFDSTEDCNDTENASLIITKSVYGHVNNKQWVMSDTPFEPTNGAVSYYQYLTHTYKVLSTDTHHKKLAYIATEPHQPLSQMHQHIPSLIRDTKDFLFPAFFNLVETYPQATFVFRTFGRDRSRVIEFLKQNPHTTHIFRNIEIGNVFYEDDVMCIEIGGVLTKDAEKNVVCVDINEEKKKVKGFDAINEYILNLSAGSQPTHLFLREDYGHYARHQKNMIWGKQLFNHPAMLQIFFDDNKCVHHPEPHTSSYFVHVNTLRVCLNPNYFVDHVSAILNAHNECVSKL